MYDITVNDIVIDDGQNFQNFVRKHANVPEYGTRIELRGVTSSTSSHNHCAAAIAPW
tara:strand:- start:216 stop:386 length:171 start_codon:yes stop_codon:yes gene_type:complete